MSHWWRAYDEAVDDPKLIMLPDKLHRAWFGLCCIASAYGGVLPEIAIIAIKLRTKVDVAKAVLAELVVRGLIDQDGHRFTMHNWAFRQYTSDVSTDRVKRHRERKRNVSRNVSVTPPDIQIQKTDPIEPLGSMARQAALDMPEPVGEDAKTKLYRIGKTILVGFGIDEKRTGALIGQWLKIKNDHAGLLALIEYARDQNVADAVSYISSFVHGKSGNGTTQQSFEDRAKRLAAEARELERNQGLR